MTPGLLPGADRDLVHVLQKRLETLFAAIMLNTKVTKVAEDTKGVRVTSRHLRRAATVGPPKEQVFDRVLVAVGRRPNSKIPGLEPTAVKVDAKGFIETDGQRRTAEPSIFAIGDVAGEPMLAHKASHEARVAVEAIAGHKAVFEPLAIPAVVFTDPEIAWAGLTEAQARPRGVEVEVAKFPWGAVEPRDHGRSAGRPDQAGPRAEDRARPRRRHRRLRRRRADRAKASLAIEMGATAEDLKLTIHAAPDALGDADGERRSVLRPEHARLQAEAKIEVN